MITVTYSSEQTLASAIESVPQQTYPDIEYILVDGNSQDIPICLSCFLSIL
jgi:glycosyltransferase involved in cell wall biosynthesis